MFKKYFWFYLIIALFVLGPLLMPGYIFTFDMVFGPHFVSEFGAGRVLAPWPVFKIIEVISYVIPNWIVQKVILLGILVFSGFNMALLFEKLFKNKSFNAAALAGIFYMLNPFVYTRFLAGHWLFLIGYALFPFWIKTLSGCITKSASVSKKHLILLFILTNTLIIVSFHHIWLLIIALIIYGILHRKAIFRKNNFPQFIYALLSTIIVQTYWLLALLLFCLNQ